VIAAREIFLVAETNSTGARRKAHPRPGLYSLLAFVVICVGTSLGNAQTAAPQTTPEAPVQLVYPPKPAGETGPPATITLADALQRAQKNNAEFLSTHRSKSGTARPLASKECATATDRLPKRIHRYAGQRNYSERKICYQ